MKRLFRGWSWEHWYNLAREDIEEAFASVRRAALIGVYVGIGLWVLSGLHIIRQNEVGLVTRFGSLARGIEQPGLHYRLPWPMASVRRVPLQTQQSVAVGMSAGGLTAAQRLGQYDEDLVSDAKVLEVEGKDEAEDSLLAEMTGEGQRRQTGTERRTEMGDGLPLLTADRNMVMVQAVVQYSINDPMRYVYQSESAPLVLRRATTTAMLIEAAGTEVDELLTTQRNQVQAAVRRRIQRQVDAYKLGITVAGVQFQRLGPPAGVSDAFRNVNTAREESNTLINEARQYASTIVPEAQGEAERLKREAEAYRATRVADAKGEAARFRGVLSEAQGGGGVVADRLRYETLERILSRANVVPASGGDLRIVEPKPTGGE